MKNPGDEVRDSADLFHRRFPWTFALPEHPMCSECLYQQQAYVFRGEDLVMIEQHGEKCSRYPNNGVEHVVAHRKIQEDE